MAETLVKQRGVKVATRVIAQAIRWTERDLRLGRIDRATYDERMARIEDERKACGLA